MTPHTITQEVSRSVGLVLAACNKNQSDLAEILDKDRSSVTRKMQGRTGWQLEELAAICETAGAPITALFDAEALRTFLADKVHPGPDPGGNVTRIERRKRKVIDARTPAELEKSPTKWKNDEMAEVTTIYASDADVSWQIPA